MRSNRQIRVLFYVPKIYEPRCNLFIGDKSGLAMYVHEIAESIKGDAEVYILTYKFTASISIDGLRYVSHTKRDFISGLRICNITKGLANLTHTPGGFTKRIKAAFLSCDLGSFERTIKGLHPDIVHFHGANQELIKQVEICQNNRVPFIVTLHGFVGALEESKTTRATQMAERNILQSSDKQNWPVTIVSSGAKKRACEMYGIDGHNIRVVLNGTKMATESRRLLTKEDIYQRHGIRKQRRLILCIGTVCDRKNQIAIVKAWKSTSISIRSQCSVLFLGVDRTNGCLAKIIQQEGLSEELILCGYIPPEHLVSYYDVAELNMVVSIDEGFGLSIIEAMRFGVPTLTYSDLDAVNDLYDPVSMLLIDERNDEALALGINNALSKTWDHSAIRRLSEKYRMESIAKEYMNLYREVIADVVRL